MDLKYNVSEIHMIESPGRQMSQQRNLWHLPTKAQLCDPVCRDLQVDGVLCSSRPNGPTPLYPPPVKRTCDR